VKITRAILADSRIPQKLSSAQKYSSAIVEMLRFSSPGGKRLATYAHASDAETTAVAIYLRGPRMGLAKIGRQHTRAPTCTLAEERGNEFQARASGARKRHTRGWSCTLRALRPIWMMC